MPNNQVETPSFSIYNASAGAGKTHTLVKEYLKILLLDKQDDAYKKILAITFTNKAVAEMKIRVISCLYAFSQNDIPQKYEQMLTQILEETALKEDYVRTKSKKIIKNIIHNYASFDISTIDKFTHKVIRSFAFDLDLPISFEVTLDSDELLQEAVDAVVSKAGVDPELTNLLIDFSIDKADNDKSWDISRELKEVGALLLNENSREEIALFAEKKLDDFVRVRDFLRFEIRSITQTTKETGSCLLDLINTNGIDVKSFSRGTFPNHLNYIANDDDKATQRKYLETEDIQINKTAKDKDLIEEYIPQFLEKLGQVYQLYAKRAFYQAFLKNITPLSLLNALGQEMDKIQQEKNILSISQFNAIIHNELQNQPAPFIYERLGERYNHFFIDEFQDTSELQWHNLIPLIDNALAGEDHSQNKGTLMIVGDPKQSIYRWRGGKAEQFIALSKGENPFSNPDKKVISLEKNYRSYSEVIQFNNLFFKCISEKFTHEDYLDLYQNNSSQQINDKRGGYVSLRFLTEGEVEEGKIKEEQYAKATLKAIQKAVAEGFDYSDIVILTRKRHHGVILANYLTENEIPILSSDSLLINNATEVRVIINVLRYLKSESDLEAKVMMLYYIANQQKSENPVAVHDFIDQGLELKKEKVFENWLKENGIDISFDRCRKKSLYEAVENIVKAFLPEKSTISYVLYFLDLVLERTVKNVFGISDFLEYWEENYQKFSIPTPEGKNAVQIMTIHKSKGLEFPVVIFPFAEEDYTRSNRDKLWLNIETEEGLDFPKALVDSKKEVADYGKLARELYEQKEEEFLLDNVNVLYVALTRAEEQLYIISYYNVTDKGELKNNMSSFFLDFLNVQGKFENDEFQYEFGNATRISEKKEREAGSVEIIHSVKKPFDFGQIKIAKREALMWDAQNQKAIEYGNIVHKVMSFIITSKDIDDAVLQALEEGLITEESKEGFTATVTSIVKHAELSEFFEEGNQVFNEKMIIGEKLSNSIPDRVVVNKYGEAFLLDYKTGKEQNKHKEQLMRYEQALQEMGYDVKKKVLLYTGGDHLNIIHL
ncbi:UvrD-helicase domain-containing protein [Myroides indicus]|uniref:DNA 3'-5' helicase n=1 Tax=Myroides indicus TaxID=1323422 RepID=A0A4R7F0A5_9FLAO|nr:UvrD-helicase domain-containing protein [Myroides indicus]TDS56583.1 ATP-dependent exoDNAse (exonuclease V) beta subunit [Myroides indicus]